MFEINFTKMHGLGNDFIVINNISNTLQLDTKIIRKLSNRHTGIGCDQLLIVEKSEDSNIDFVYRIFNQDGSVSGQCGNGARCLAKFIWDNHLSEKKSLTLKTVSTTLEVTMLDNHLIRVNMGVPISVQKYQHQDLNGIFVDLGNPHIVFEVDNINDSALFNLGLDKYNIGFMQKVSSSRIKLRVFERGAGETLACGSGACAAVIAGIYEKVLDQTVTVELNLGSLEVKWQGEDQPVWLSGPAEKCFEGIIKIK
jgi:diaminopimelate epimerase